MDRDQYSEQETAQRRDAVIKRMLSTPPRPHSEMKIGKSRDKSKKTLQNEREKSPISEPEISIQNRKLWCPLSFEPNECRECSRCDRRNFRCCEQFPHRSLRSKSSTIGPGNPFFPSSKDM
jgi:hypothetical protein